MATSVSNGAIWEEIDRCESYLVCCMFEEAISLASSVLRRLCDNECTKAGENIELNDMLESAGMVLVQSLKELGRTSEILNELKLLFGPVTGIPIQVLLTGVYFQISEAPSGVREFLEEFLGKWKYMNEQYYVLVTAEADMSCVEGCERHFMIGVDKYLEVVEVYVITFLGMVLGEMDLAISWVEKATLPDEKRQELLRRLHSLCSTKQTSLSHGSSAPSLADELDTSEGSPKALKAHFLSKEDGDRKKALLKSSGLGVKFWWFRTINSKFGNAQFVRSNRNILFCCLMLLIYLVLRRKRANLKRVLKRQASAMKKALVDLWQLAFSYQVNPLAAVQPLAAATHGGR